MPGLLAPSPVPAAGVPDLDQCAQEPIHIPGSIQPHGALAVLDPDTLAIRQASRNLQAFLGLGAPVHAGDPLPVDLARIFTEEMPTWGSRSAVPGPRGDSSLHAASIDGRRFQITTHRTAQGLLVEFEHGEPSDVAAGHYKRLRDFADRLEGAEDVRELARLAAETVRDFTGFNRVLVYRFDPSWNGAVIAEESDDVLRPYLDHHFPASDIPAQARALYLKNRLRIIPNADYAPVPIEPVISPADNQPIDLSLSALRSVSPIHLEYMRNMETWASMSVSIVVEGRLWGLISCHHRTPRQVDPQARLGCDVVGQMLALQVGARQRAALATRRIELKGTETRLLAYLSQCKRFQDSLAAHAQEWMALTGATGAALVAETEVVTAGATPSIAQLTALAEWLRESGNANLFATDCLSADFAAAAEYAEQASGLLAVSISQIHPSFMMWFRPEVVRTITWGGDPRKPVTPGPDRRIHPRKSFAQWVEQVRRKSLPWSQAEIDSANDFRTSVVNFVLRQAEERAELTSDLERINKELESFSYSVSHDLRAPFRHIVGFTELLQQRETHLDEKSMHYLRSIGEAALAAGKLVDNLLSFSHLGRRPLSVSRVDVRKLVMEVIRSFEADIKERPVEWRIGDLPPAMGDAALLRQVFHNLIDNALKYSRDRRPAVIDITGERRGAEVVYVIGDNGVGFDQAYAHKLFGVFQRLHRQEDFEGTGIGLALAKRVIERHGGWISAHGELGRGATIRFGLPLNEKERFLARP